MTLIKKITVFCILLISAGSQHAFAQNTSSWVMDAYTRSRIFVGDYEADKKILHLGWQVSLKDGWKTYWRSPGEAGLPPRWHWGNKPENIKRITVSWPAPQRLNIFNMDTFVYHNELVLPIDVEVIDPARPVHIALDLEFMICKHICIPLEAHYEISIPPAGEQRPSLFQKALLDRYQQRVPEKRGDENVSLYVSHENAGTDLLVDFAHDQDGIKEIIIEGPEGYIFGAAKAVSSTKTQRYKVAISSDKAAEDLVGEILTVTIIAQNEPAYEVRTKVRQKNQN